MFTTVRCFMLGVALPALDVAGIAGAEIPDSHQGRRRICDVYGHQLGLATLPGDDWRHAWHDPMVRLLESHAVRAGASHAGHARMLLSRRAYVGLSQEGGRGRARSPTGARATIRASPSTSPH